MTSMKGIFYALVWLACAHVVAGGVFPVSGTATGNIQTTMNTANSNGDVVLLSAATYAGSCAFTMNAGASITLQGVAGSVIQCSGDGFTLNGENGDTIALVNIVGTGAQTGQATPTGGYVGVSATDSGLTLKNVSITGFVRSVAMASNNPVSITGSYLSIQSSNAINGSGIYLSRGSLYVQDTIITGNVDGGSVDSGAGLYVNTQGTARLHNVTFSGNQAYKGASIYNLGVTNATACTISNSPAVTGAVCNEGGQLTLLDSIVFSNTGYLAGGVASIGGTLTIMRTAINRNSASSALGANLYNGAAIYCINNAVCNITGSTLSNNVANGGGSAGIASAQQYTTLSVSNSSAFNNAGAAFSVTSHSNATFAKVYTLGQLLTITGDQPRDLLSATVTDCFVTGAYIGLDAGPFTSLVMHRTTFLNNNAGATCHGRYCEVVNSTFTNNHGYTNGLYLTAYCIPDYVFISGCTFNGNGGASGGAILTSPFVYGTITGCTFINNYATATGGAVTVMGTNVLIDSCTFIGNYADPTNPTSTGGAIATVPKDTTSPITLNVTNCYFQDNIATTGGAISVGVVTITNPPTTNIYFGNNVFNNNTATLTGGAVQFTDNVVFNGSRFMKSYAKVSGGAIAGKGNLNVVGCSFNTSYSPTGGGIFLTGTGSSTITGSTFNSLSAGAGGALYSEVGHTTLVQGATVTQNTASTTGAGLVIGSGTISGSTIYANSATMNGGGVAGVFLGTLTVTTSNIYGNTAGGGGGGVVSGLQSTLILSGLTVTGNTAVSGGGVALDFVSSGSMMTNLAVFNNVASGSGGGINIYPSMTPGTGFLNNSRIYSNTAAQAGGGVTAQSWFAITNTSVTGNRALEGAGVYATSTLNLIGANISSNAATDGAGVSCKFCTINLLRNTRLTDNTANDGGALLCNQGSALYADTSVQFVRNNQSVYPQLAANCAPCGCCAVPTTPATLQGDNCFLFGNRGCGYTCDVGYTKNNASLVCQTNGGQVAPPNYPNPLCQPIACDANVPHRNGSVVFSPAGPVVTGTVATFSCDFGFDLNGTSNTARCVGPDWIDPFPACKPKLCVVLPAPANGRVDTTGGGYGDIATFSCNVGYRLSGTDTATCTGTIWTPASPTCEALPCQPLDPPRNGSVIFSSGTGPILTGANAIFSCDVGYQIVGNLTCMCLGGNWTSAAPRCGPLECPEMLPPANGRVFNAHASTGDFASFTCDCGYTLMGATRRECRSPVWLDNTPTCAPATCNVNDTDTHLSSNCGGEVPYQGLCTVFCSAGYYSADPQGDTVRLCVQRQGVNCGLTATLDPPEPNCLPCDPGSFSAANAPACTPCPYSGRTLDLAATSMSACLCAPGFYEHTIGEGDCEPCPTGALCSGDKDRPSAAPGYYSVDQAFAACTPAVACAGGDKCSKGYTGFLCGACDDFFYRLNGQCHACPTDGPWRIIVVVLAAMIAAVTLVLLVVPGPISERTYGYSSITIGISFVQVVATFVDLKVHWPQLTRNMFDVFSTLNLNIEIASPECVIRLDFYSKFQAQLLIPFAVAGLFLLVWPITTLIIWYRQGKPRWELARLEAIRILKITVSAFLFFMTVSYLFLARATLSVFACVEKGDEYSLSSSPSDKCFSAVWSRNAVFGVFGILFYIIGIPIAVHAVYLRTRSQFGPHVAVSNLFSNFLVRKYRVDTWMWEAVIMLRKLLVVIIATFIRDPYVQVAACCTVIFIALIASLLARPYQWAKHNFAECTTLICAMIILFCGQLSGNPQFDVGQQQLGDGFSVTAILVAACVLVGCFGIEVYVYVQVKRLARQLQPNQETSVPAGNAAVVAVLPYAGRVFTLNADGGVRGWDPKTLLPWRAFETRVQATYAAICDTHLVLAHGSTIDVWSFQSQQSVGIAVTTSPIVALAAAQGVIVCGHVSGEVTFWRVTRADGKALPSYDTMANEGAFASITSKNMASTSSGTGNAFDTNSSMGSMAAPAGLESNPVFGANPNGGVTAPPFTPPPAKPEKEGAEEGDTPAAPVILRSHTMGAREELKLTLESTQRSDGTVTALTVASRFLYSAHANGHVIKWNVDKMEMMRDFSLKLGPDRSVTISTMEEIGSHLLYGTSDGALHAFAFSTERSVSYRGQQRPVVSITACDDMVIGASSDGSIVVMHLHSGKYLQRVFGITSEPKAILVRPEDRTLLWGDFTGTLRKRTLDPRWSVVDADPYVMTRIILRCKMWWRKKRGASTSSTVGNPDEDDPSLQDGIDLKAVGSLRSRAVSVHAGATDAHLYEELEILSRDLKLPLDTQRWAGLHRETVGGVVTLLAEEAARRRAAGTRPGQGATKAV